MEEVRKTIAKARQCLQHKKDIKNTENNVKLRRKGQQRAFIMSKGLFDALGEPDPNKWDVKSN